LLGRTEDKLEQFLWLRCSTRWGGALGTRGQASDGLSGRRGDLTRARVSGFGENSGKRSNWEPRAKPRRRLDLL
jgi:hypothetical protein